MSQEIVRKIKICVENDNIKAYKEFVKNVIEKIDDENIILEIMSISISSLKSSSPNKREFNKAISILAKKYKKMISLNKNNNVQQKGL